MARVRVGMDTCIASRLAEIRLGVPVRLKGPHLLALRSLAGRGDISWHQSRKLLEETSHTKGAERRAALLEVVDNVPTSVPTTPRFTLTPGMIVAASSSPATPSRGALGVTPLSGAFDPRWGVLTGLFDVGDAEHIYDAVEAGCDFFLTTDEATILQRVAARPGDVAHACGSLQILSPSDLLAKLDA